MICSISLVGEDDDKRAFLFYRNEDVSEEFYLNYFSVPSHTRFPNIKNRAVVEYRGDDTGIGTWKCTKDAGATSCPHIVTARHSLQQYMKGDWNARDEAIAEDEVDSIRFGSA